MKLFLSLLPFSFMSLLSSGKGLSLNKIHPNLLQKESDEFTANIFLTFVQGTEHVLEYISLKRFESRNARLNAVHDALVANSATSQAESINILNTYSYPYKSMWITNQLYIKGATMDLVIELAKGENVAYISEEEIFSMHRPVYLGQIQKKVSQTEKWGVAKIMATEARNLLNNSGIPINPIIVGSIDTGVRYTHEALKENWRGDYGWWDPVDRSKLPKDTDGHGTHTMGTICGNGGIGVYPEAKWMACRGCVGWCSEYALLSCSQWIVCPTLSNGTARDCSKAPHLISNSWGGGGGRNWFERSIAAFHAAKIIPLFANGNTGSACNTTGSPADRKNVISVGSTTKYDTLSDFSSVGPAFDGTMKPEITAPGSNILSAIHTGDNEYRVMSGTSMACPHVAGVVAILLAYNKDLEYSRVVKLLKEGADTKLLSGKRTCAGIPDTKFPNHQFGYGRVNAVNTLRALINN